MRFLLIFTICSFIEAKSNLPTVYLDQMCANDQYILDGDQRPGIFLQLTSSNKYKPNSNCTMKFRTAQPSQRFIVTMEKLDIVDCPADKMLIYDGPTLLNKDLKQQCGTNSTFTFSTNTDQLSITFTSNAVIESTGFQIALALSFPTVRTCPQILGFFQCKNGNCISKQLTCDGHNHCGDRTDEIQC